MAYQFCSVKFLLNVLTPKGVLNSEKRKNEMPVKPCLDFKDGQFTLGRTGQGGTIPLDLKAAAEFRFFATENAERVFNRALNKFYKAPILPSLPFLDPHQLAGIKWVLSRKRSYLAHAPGAGKTAEATVAYLCSGLYPLTRMVIIVPPHLTANWQREIAKFYDLYFSGQESDNAWPRVALVPQSPKRHTMNWGADFIIVPSSMMTKPWVYKQLRTYRNHFVAVDEASMFKEATSERSVIFYGGKIGGTWHQGLFANARHVVFLDGSPMPNRHMELWAPLYCLDPMAIDGLSQRDFGFRYCGPTQNERGNYEFNGATRAEELRERITKSFMHVVTENQLKHPERRRSILFMDKDPRSNASKAWERKALSSLGDDIDENASQGDLATIRRELGLNKVKWVSDYVRFRLEKKNESIIVFAWHRDVAEQLAAELGEFSPSLIIGGVKAAAREKAFRDFQSGKTKVIVGNILAMGRGHNLQRADRLVFAEFSWSDETNKQCEHRASRRGREQSKFVRCEYVAVPNSIDERVLRSNFTKESRVRKVIG